MYLLDTDVISNLRKPRPHPPYVGWSGTCCTTAVHLGQAEPPVRTGRRGTRPTLTGTVREITFPVVDEQTQQYPVKERKATGSGNQQRCAQ